MRDVVVHRGGPLGLVEHRLLAIWSAACAEGVLTLFSELNPEDFRPEQALETARAWASGEVPVGAAQRAVWAVWVVLSQPTASIAHSL